MTYSTEYRREKRTRVAHSCPKCGSVRLCRQDYTPKTELCPKCARVLAVISRSKDVWFVEYRCAICGNPFTMHQKAVDWQKKTRGTTIGAYCSRDCFAQALHLGTHPMDRIQLRKFQGLENLTSGLRDRKTTRTTISKKAMVEALRYLGEEDDSLYTR